MASLARVNRGTLGQRVNILRTTNLQNQLKIKNGINFGSMMRKTQLANLHRRAIQPLSVMSSDFKRMFSTSNQLAQLNQNYTNGLPMSEEDAHKMSEA